MALAQALVLAQFSIDFATDTLTVDFGMDATSFVIVIANQSYTIAFDDDSQAQDSQRQVLHSTTGAVVASEGQPLITSPAGLPESLSIISTNLAGAGAASANTRRFTVIRMGAVS